MAARPFAACLNHFPQWLASWPERYVLRAVRVFWVSEVNRGRLRPKMALRCMQGEGMNNAEGYYRPARFSRRAQLLERLCALLDQQDEMLEQAQAENRFLKDLFGLNPMDALVRLLHGIDD